MTIFSEDLNTLSRLFAANKEPATQVDFNTFLEELKQYGVHNPAIPNELESLWKIASEWHLIADHYNVFGFNIYGPKTVLQTTKNVFGEEEIRQDWASDHGEDSCGGADWLCLAGYTEFDYIFMNFNSQSKLFGATRHMVNNCNDDREFTNAPFVEFVKHIKANIEKYKEDAEESA
ncbi:hypothetical protein INT43_005614 [Umbelopsis isabellina]|uniref:Uncharacterized protein n=1 Tax=Mortierella isabellina TaxID=91625 RepID=A0A8H7PMC7_MORIS|nr:hypothetical protein INT43_005614 [Umbelopsis isabellina]